ncbi:anthranilate synthase component I family protein [Gelidibacter salicanalis]|uniref:Anthranilate synthase component I family protein n=1 Tax=Gelidibacter salicanalis TaxID=291193 RepID=A0A934NBT1_9FLAO|nr:anthranilate synthase component I family protein [Gelidibacter salicanalis]MBJ7879975.1 anthranilate synthase component I family protein [Gelidibacter salicanalis]
MRTRHTFTITNPDFKAQLLQWSQQFEEVVWLDSNSHQQHYSTYDTVLAVDAFTCISTDCQQAFDQLQEYQTITKDWIFGYFTYDLKNDIEHLKSEHVDGLDFPELFFFQPKKLFLITGDVVEMQYLKMVDDELESDLKDIAAYKLDQEGTPLTPVNIQMRLTKEQYLEKVNTMLAHIHRGDIYEANFCHEFYAEKTEIDPLETYIKLNTISKAPFAAYFKNHQHYVLCASPERYLTKINQKVISQPIKGTATRSTDTLIDENLKNELQNNPKERSENIMIVDLVRNDLAHTAKKGSVTVEELCAVYTFEQVHQMISTITSEVDANIPPVQIVKTTFPMGSMTGAPKISAMQIIENLEATKRGLYSGSIGYFTPAGDFDFNVIIRSILYNAENRYVSYSVGSAITSKSDPLKEFEECLIKAKAMKEVLEN